MRVLKEGERGQESGEFARVGDQGDLRANVGMCGNGAALQDRLSR